MAERQIIVRSASPSSPPGAALELISPAHRDSVSPEELGSLERQLFIRQLMAAPPGPTAALLARNMRDVRAAPGDVLYEQGTAPRDVYFIVRGAVEARAAGEDPWRFDAPALLGAIDALHDRPRARSCVAVTHVRALALAAEEWFEAIEEHFELAVSGMQRTSENLGQMRVAIEPDGAFGEPPAVGPPRSGLNLIERLRLLRDVALLRGATVEAVARLAAAAEEIELPQGRALFREGEPAARIVIVASGHVEVRRDKPAIVARFGPGQMVGGAAACQLVNPWTASAASDAIVLAIRREDLLDTMEDHTELVRSVMMAISLEREEMLRHPGARAALGGARPSGSMPKVG